VLVDAGSNGGLPERRIGPDGVVRIEPEQALPQTFCLVGATLAEGGIGRQQKELIAEGLVLLLVKCIGQFLVDLDAVCAHDRPSASGQSVIGQRRAAGGPDLLLQNTKAPGPKRDGSVSPGRKLVVRRGPIRPRFVVFVSASPRTALRKGSSKWA